MYLLIALFTMTTLGQYSTEAECTAAVRAIYVQKLDPYNFMHPDDVKEVVDVQMKYDAPKKYRCQKQ